MRAVLCVVWTAWVGSVAWGAAIGYGGDGSFVAAGKPPADFDAAAGRNVLWKAQLPNWCLGAPIVARDRVFVMSEPDRDFDFPTLLCLSAADGKILWRTEIDHLGAIPADQRQAAGEAWKAHLAALRELYRVRHEYRSADDPEAALKALADRGFVQGKGGIDWKERADVRLARVFNRAGLYFDVWHLGGLSRIGYAFPTPVTDGSRIYVATGLHVYACFDLEGNNLWTVQHRGQGSSQAGYGGDDFCKNARSPLLHGDLLISDVGNLVRGIDKNTGKLLWSHKLPGHEITSPVILRIDGKDILLTYGPHAFILPEGAPLRVEGWKNNGASYLVRSDSPDTVFVTGGGEHGGWENKGNCSEPPPAAVRFSLGDGVLKARVLWAGVDGKQESEHTGMVYHNGRLYHPHGVILDADSGKVIKGKARGRGSERATPQTRHMLWVADGRVYGLREVKGRDAQPTVGSLEVYDLEGKRLGEYALPVPVAEGERRDRIIETVGATRWGFSYGSPFLIHAGRIYIRGNDLLWCIGSRD